MTTGSDSVVGPTGETNSRWNRSLLPACLVLGAAICGLLVFYGSLLRAATELEKAHAIEAEDQVFCTRFGVGPETTRYSECVDALKDVRSRHDERNAAPY